MKRSAFITTIFAAPLLALLGIKSKNIKEPSKDWTLMTLNRDGVPRVMKFDEVNDLANDPAWNLDFRIVHLEKWKGHLTDEQIEARIGELRRHFKKV